MIEVKKNGLTVFVEPTKLVGDVAIGISFPLNCNSCTFNRLCGSSSCACTVSDDGKTSQQCFPSGSEESIIGYALCTAVRQILCGDPLAVSRSKVGSVECIAHNGNVGINWKIKGTGSAIRKSLGLAINVLDPIKMFPAYSRFMKQFGQKVDKDVFHYVADAASRSIKSSLIIGIVGNTKVDKPTLEGILDVIIKKHDPTDVKVTKTKPSRHVPCDHSELTELKITGWQSAVFADYVRMKVKGLAVIPCNSNVLVTVKSAQWDTIRSKLKKGVSDYVQMKYARVGDNLVPIFSYLALSSVQLCSHDVRSAINDKLSNSSISAAINKGL